ncbi:MAG: HD domain-containing protein [Defluviitaleaceae bacterium]|nr:HD domain-containing protein [Defluviitaleaceae bacterium]
MTPKLASQIKFITEADKLKSIYRQTLITDKSRNETSAEHSWHLALMAMTLIEYSANPVDLDRVIKMAIVHDLVELYAGDTPAFADTIPEDKLAEEQAAADKLFALLPADQAAEYRGLWEEFDEMKTPDAMYAAAVDRVQPLLSNHLTNGHSWVKFNVDAARVYKRMEPIKTAIPALWELVESVISEGVEKGYIRP